MKHWIHGLIAATIGGGANAITLIIIDPLKFNLQEGLTSLLSAATVSGLLSAALYLKQSPIPSDDDDHSPPAGGMVALLLLMLLMPGCASVTPSNESASNAAKWVKDRSGFIENAVSSITQIAVYATEKDTADRTQTIELLHAIAGNINALVANGVVDPDSVAQALKIKEPYFGPILQAISNIIQAETNQFKENGYGDLTIAILVAVSKGISDGTTE